MTDPRFAQLTYTSFDPRGAGGGGWQIKELRGQLTDGQRDDLLSGVDTTFGWPVEIPPYLAPSAQAELPERLVHARVRSGGTAHWHTSPAGLDGTGRPGNVFVHALLDRAREDSPPLVRPSDLALSEHWLRPFGQDQVLAAALDPLPAPPWPAPAPSSLVGPLVDQDGAKLLLAVLLDALHAALAGGPRVVLAADTAAGAQWIAALGRLMSPGTGRRFHWSTAERAGGLRIAWQQGLHLAVVPPADLAPGADVGDAVVVRQDVAPRLGSLNGEPHQGACSPPVRVTEWSVLADAVLQDLDTALAGLAELDRVAAEVGDRGLDPVWPLAMAASLLALPDTDEALTVLRVASPPGLPPRLRDRIDDPVLREIGGPGPAAAHAFAAGCREPAVGRTASRIYLERAVADRDWLCAAGGVPVPPVVGDDLVEIARRAVIAAEREVVGPSDGPIPPGSAAVPVARALDRSAAPSSRDPVVEAVRALRLLDLLARARLLPGADDPDDEAGEAGRNLVERTVLPALTHPDLGRSVLEATGALDEHTQVLFVRPVLRTAVHQAGMTGDLCAPAVLRWLFPQPPATTGFAGEPDPLLVELAAQVTAVVPDPSELRPLALWGLVQRAAAGEDVGAALDRLRVPSLWSPRDVAVAMGLVPAEDVAAVTLGVLATAPPGPELTDLLARLSDREPLQDEPSTGRAVAVAVQLRRRVATQWWKGRPPEGARRVLEAAEDLEAHCAITAPDVLEHALASIVVSAVFNESGDELSRELMAIVLRAAEHGRITAAAERIADVDEADDIAIAMRAVMSAPSAPWNQDGALWGGRLSVLAGLHEPTGPVRPPLLDRVVRVRRRRGRLSAGFGPELLARLQHTARGWDPPAAGRRPWDEQFATFVPVWLAGLGLSSGAEGRMSKVRRALGAAPRDGGDGADEPERSGSGVGTQGER